MNLCEESCVDDNAKKEVSVLPRTTSKSVTAEYSVVNTFPTKTSMTYDIGTTMVNAPAHTVNTTITPTACQCLGTPTPAITPAITSCSPCTRIASTVNFTVTKTSNTTIKDFVTVTSTVWAPCTLTPTARESRSYSLTTKTIIIVSTAQQSSASLTQMHVDQIQEDKVCSLSAVSALGALLGMFTVLLAIVTAGWIWTCWIVKKRGRMVVNSKQNK